MPNTLLVTVTDASGQVTKLVGTAVNVVSIPTTALLLKGQPITLNNQFITLTKPS